MASKLMGIQSLLATVSLLEWMAWRSGDSGVLLCLLLDLRPVLLGVAVSAEEGLETL